MRRSAALVLVLALVLTGCSNSRDRIREALDTRYESVDNSSVPNAAPDTRTYRSPEPVEATADAIAAAVRPADRTTGQGGTFLRYRGAIVGVIDAGDGQSFVTLDDEERGRTRWFPIIGPVFGRPGGGGIGGGGGVRGGGPGAGK